jgi:MerR family transcriptional regulator, light-induced transcriptional regulator
MQGLMSTYSIKDLEKLTGVKAHTIRIWEKRYGIVQPQRTDSNIRCYSNYDLKRLLNISILNKRGYKISALAGLSADELRDKVMHLVTDHNMYDAQIESLIIAMIDMNESKFEKTLSNAVLEIGFEETLMKIVYPFFTKIGILWQTGTIHPGQEHFVSNLIRQKIIAAIENLEAKHLPKAKLFILFLPEEEYHELGLLFYAYLIKKVGHKMVYLGQSTPVEDVFKAASIHEPDFLLTNFTSPVAQMDVNEYITNLCDKFSGKKMFVSGIQLTNQKALASPQIRRIQDPAVFKQELLELLR